MKLDTASLLIKILSCEKGLKDDTSGATHASQQTDRIQSTIPDRELLQLICRLQNLHVKARDESIISATTISQGLRLWENIDKWEGFDCDHPASLCNGEAELRWLYKSSLFIWLHLIIYPRSIDSEKLQNLVAPGMEFLGSKSVFQSPELLLFPIFFHGLGSNEEIGRQLTAEALESLRSDIDEAHLEICEATLRWCWDNYDNEVDKSWDWTNRAAS
ncbi:hypothetical protein N7456_010836 [Penicillium angulare]|uniref:Uncharacterized protein n=1 Tax=Penicillium angulare TaxID=116970 RepID=A0A9W9ESQ6_9EURO|nr:hypothetical protein N7456_010836 [Penicillium angulare]